MIKQAAPDEESGRARGPNLKGKVAAVCAAIIIFECVLVLAGGLSWSLAGFGVSDSLATAGVFLAVLLAAASSVWLFRRAWQIERERANRDAS